MKHNLWRSIVLAALALAIPAMASAGTVKVSMHDGRVTIVAEDASVRQILDEWARVGQTRIVNADKVFGPSVTLQLIDVPERDALDTLLRSVSGYIAAPRPVVLANASVYDRVTIMPTSHAPAMNASAAPVPTYQRPPVSPADDDMPVNMMQEALQQQMEQLQQQRAQQPATSPALMPYPGMQPPAQGRGPATSPQPGMPPVMTSPTPGALPQPQPQGQPGMTPNPYQPSVVRPVGPGGPGGPGRAGGPGGGGN